MIHKLDTACRSYQAKYPKATITLGSVAPANDKCVEYNVHVENLAAERRAPFISTEEMFDQKGQIKTNCMDDDVHYSKQGITHIAKQIKRNLYDYKTIPRVHKNYQPRMVHFQHIHPHNQSAPFPGNVHPQMHAFRNLLSLAMSILPPQ